MLIELTSWLKSSIAGIIILGAVGSIAAVLVIDLVRWVFKRFVIVLIFEYLVQHVRPYVTAKILTRRFVRRGQVESSIYNIVFSVCSFFFRSILVSSILVATLIGFYQNHSQGSGVSNWSIVLLIATLICLHYWLNAVFSLYGIYSELMEHSLREVGSLLKSSMSVADAMSIMRKELKESPDSEGWKIESPVKERSSCAE